MDQVRHDEKEVDRPETVTLFETYTVEELSERRELLTYFDSSSSHVN